MYELWVVSRVAKRHAPAWNYCVTSPPFRAPGCLLVDAVFRRHESITLGTLKHAILYTHTHTHTHWPARVPGSAWTLVCSRALFHPPFSVLFSFVNTRKTTQTTTYEFSVFAGPFFSLSFSHKDPCLFPRGVWRHGGSGMHRARGWDPASCSENLCNTFFVGSGRGFCFFSSLVSSYPDFHSLSLFSASPGLSLSLSLSLSLLLLVYSASHLFFLLPLPLTLHQIFQCQRWPAWQSFDYTPIT